MKRIEVGDIVNIYFTTSNALIEVLVLHKPSDIGDSWYLESTANSYGQTKGQSHAVIIYERMDCIKKME
jgi:hypothetical protein